ncbi:OFA family MFS transporter [Sulfuracidifex metallicus]|uniref:OFA family MFS transporter n=1 Tax=Sulfuracidifex metallicus TaxID=47303 RepID=UPI002273442C|nr:OFA family MFS transporter [Sulfuracidifex metallicus]MCY0850974.1 OFA family MFS transporter [Sulfuracidifex metallicus]
MERRQRFIVIGLITMLFNSLYQYSWNALEPLFRVGFNVSLVEVEVAFTLFTIFSTGFQTVGGHFADRDGPRKVGVISAILAAAGFLGTSFSNSIYQFYAWWSLGSIGEGILYGIASNLAVKWYPDRRGFATGLVSLGFGVGASAINPLIETFTSFREPTLIIGIAEIFAIPLLMWFAEYPKKQNPGKTPADLLKTWGWWVLYLSFVMAAVPLTVMSSSLAYLAKDFSPQYLALLISVFPFMSGVSRPIIGHLSDKIGRVRSVAMTDLMMFFGSLFLFYGVLPISAVIIGFFGGSTITLYFSLVGDLFGSRYSTSNNAILYTGKAVAGVLGGVVFSYLFLVSHIDSFIYVTSTSVLGLVLLLVSVKVVRSREQKDQITTR